MSIIMHTKPGCVYCERAKEFMLDKHIPFTTVCHDPKSEIYEREKNALVAKTHHPTFPQIFVGETFVGGYSELVMSYSTFSLHILCNKIGINLDADFDF